MTANLRVPLLWWPASEHAPQFSPDGRWVAYASDESGGLQVYVAPYPGPGRGSPISIDGGEATNSGTELGVNLVGA